MAAPVTAPPSVAASAPAAPVVDPVIAAVRIWFEDAGNASKAVKADADAATAFYAARTGAPLWIDGTSFNAKAKAAIDEVRRADDWGLAASAFNLPSLAESAPSTEALAAAEGQLTLELLKYARFARGGRVNPASLSRILDVVAPVKDANAVIADLALAAAPDAYLRDLHPKHPQFQNLHKALKAARGPAESAVEVDPALKVSLPPTKVTLKVGVDAPQVALLRQRLKTPAEAGAKDTLFDDKLALAVRAFQAQHGLKETGQLSGATRQALNREVDAHREPDRERDTQLIVLNMERWRWMPEDLGSTHVWNNIPEYMTRVIKGDDEILKERIIVGLPAWATPVFSADMDHLVFNPSWGMPNGIKTRELQPRLRAAGGGGDFFSQLFGGGGGAAASIRAHGLKVYAGGREISPESVNWATADVRNYSFIQPPGPKNPLGTVKFMFPNKHDVYMHDTIERPLFAQSSRALSHGCIRVQNPDKFAAVILTEANQLDAAGISRARSGGEIRLKQHIPVHMTYFTAVANAQGQVSTFSDIYGHDSRLSSALTGRALRLEPVIETSSADTAEPAEAAGNAKQRKTKKKVNKAPDTLADAISGFWLN